VSEPAGERSKTVSRGWSGAAEATTLVLLRHGATDHSIGKLFSGGLTGADPALNEAGIAQVRASAEWLATADLEPAGLISSPVRRTRETAAIVAERLGLTPDPDEPGFAEMDFGVWDGLTFAEIQQRHPEELAAWLGDFQRPAGGGESFAVVRERVLAARDRVLEAYAGRTVLVVSHVSPIKVLVADAVGAPLDALYRMELSLASVSTIAYYRDGDRWRPSLRHFNTGPVAG
jgi:probable phosphoglycerate mutase